MSFKMKKFYGDIESYFSFIHQFEQCLDQEGLRWTITPQGTPGYQRPPTVHVDLQARLDDGSATERDHSTYEIIQDRLSKYQDNCRKTTTMLCFNLGPIPLRRIDHTRLNPPPGATARAVLMLLMFELRTHYGSWSAINEELIRAKTLAIPVATTPTEVEATAFNLLFINRELKSLAHIPCCSFSDFFFFFFEALTFR